MCGGDATHLLSAPTHTPHGHYISIITSCEQCKITAIMWKYKTGMWICYAIVSVVPNVYMPPYEVIWAQERKYYCYEVLSQLIRMRWKQRESPLSILTRLCLDDFTFVLRWEYLKMHWSKWDRWKRVAKYVAQGGGASLNIFYWIKFFFFFNLLCPKERKRKISKLINIVGEKS